MLDGPSVVRVLAELKFTHVVWIPDSELGTWNSALSAAPGLTLVRVCREGEAFAVAAGLLIGGAKPLIMIQCTGLFEAGDSLRNFLHDLKLPLVMIVGVRSYHLHHQGKAADSCPVFTEPILSAWQVPHVLFKDGQSADDFSSLLRQAEETKKPLAILIPE